MRKVLTHQRQCFCGDQTSGFPRLRQEGAGEELRINIVLLQESKHSDVENGPNGSGKAKLPWQHIFHPEGCMPSPHGYPQGYPAMPLS